MTFYYKNLTIYLLKKVVFSNYFNYSVLSATTGSFLDADLAGINPPIIVSTTLNITNKIPDVKGNTAFISKLPVTS